MLQEDRKQLDRDLRSSRDVVVDLKSQLEFAQVNTQPSFVVNESMADVELQQEKEEHQKTRKKVHDLTDEVQ